MKIERHAKIVDLIHKYEIETQDELAELLNKDRRLFQEISVN